MARPPFNAVAGFARQIYRAGAAQAADIILDNLQDMGADALISAVGGGGTPLGMLLSSFIRYNSTVSRDFNRQENKPMTAAETRSYRRRHAEWLRDNRWRFDWRSQPRRPAGTDEGGEWMEGRLDHMAEMKNPYSRSQRQRAIRSVKAYKSRQRAAGNMNTRTIRTAWGDF